MHSAISWETLLREVRSGRSVKTDSRLVEPGDVFASLPSLMGRREEHMMQAERRGAVLFVLEEGVDLPRGVQAPVLYRPDLREAVGELAAARYGTDLQTMRRVGVTGTNGKTTVSYLVEHMGRAAGLHAGVLGTVAYRWNGHEEQSGMTTPDCWKLHELLHRMDRDGVELVCLEVSSHALDQNRVAGIDFDVAVFTNLTQDHLDYHPTMEAYFSAKSVLFSRAQARPRTAVVNVDSDYGVRLFKDAGPRIGTTLDPTRRYERDVLSGSLIRNDASGVRMDIFFGSRVWELVSPLIGRHNAENLLSAFGVGLALGLDDRALLSLGGATGAPGRLERVPNCRGLHVFVDYAHTPDALEKVLAGVRNLPFKRLITVFGCGGDRDRSKRPLMGEAVARFSDVAILTSDNPRHEDPLRIMQDVAPGLEKCPRVFMEPDRRRAIAAALDMATRNDVVLLAGKGHESTQQIGDTRIPFRDRDVAMEILECA